MRINSESHIFLFYFNGKHSFINNCAHSLNNFFFFPQIQDNVLDKHTEMVNCIFVREKIKVILISLQRTISSSIEFYSFQFRIHEKRSRRQTERKQAKNQESDGNEEKNMFQFSSVK